LALDGKTFFFVSNRPGFCGLDDIFTSRRSGTGWTAPVNLGCDTAGGPNSAANEAGPSPVYERRVGLGLYFSSTRAGTSDIYRSSHDGDVFGPATVVPELSTSATDGQPNVRQDGLEIFLFSNRPGSVANSNDIWSATRSRTTDPWSAPVNLGPAVNTDASETRPSLSVDGRTLYFGSNRPGGDGDADHYVTTRRVPWLWVLFGWLAAQ
jgi:hypothetical protein